VSRGVVDPVNYPSLVLITCKNCVALHVTRCGHWGAAWCTALLSCRSNICLSLDRSPRRILSLWLKRYGLLRPFGWGAAGHLITHPSPRGLACPFDRCWHVKQNEKIWDPRTVQRGFQDHSMLSKLTVRRIDGIEFPQ